MADSSDTVSSERGGIETADVSVASESGVTADNSEDQQQLFQENWRRSEKRLRIKPVCRRIPSFTT